MVIVMHKLYPISLRIPVYNWIDDCMDGDPNKTYKIPWKQYMKCSVCKREFIVNQDGEIIDESKN